MSEAVHRGRPFGTGPISTRLMALEVGDSIRFDDRTNKRLHSSLTYVKNRYGMRFTSRTTSLGCRVTRIAGVALLALRACGAEPAWAAPPPAGSEDAQVLGPFRAWMESQQGPWGWCCDVSDGRMVDARITGNGQWQVRFVHPETLDEPPPPGWIDVPEDAVIRNGNPTGVPVAWIFQGRIRCFAPASGT